MQRALLHFQEAGGREFLTKRVLSGLQACQAPWPEQEQRRWGGARGAKAAAWPRGQWVEAPPPQARNTGVTLAQKARPASAQEQRRLGTRPMTTGSGGATIPLKAHGDRAAAQRHGGDGTTLLPRTSKITASNPLLHQIHHTGAAGQEAWMSLASQADKDFPP